MPKCEKCGNEFDGDFCTVCGTKTEESAVCPYCGAMLIPNAKFCPHCGKPVSAEQPRTAVIKNETKRDLEFSERMNYYMVGKKNRRMFFICALMFILLAGFIFGYEYLMSNGEKYDFAFMAFLIFLGVIFFIFALMHKSMIRKAIQKNMQGKEATNAYTFTDEGYEITTQVSDGTMSRTWGGYGSFTEVKEFSDMWLLYVNGMTAFPVSKSGMTAGTAEELTALLSRAVGARYRVCFKK